MSTAFIYFDLGNVLLSFSHERMFLQLSELTGVSPEEVRTAIQHPQDGATQSLQTQYESGLIDDKAYHHQVCQALGVRTERDEFFRAASDIFAAIDESVELVRSLDAAGNRLGVLSNTSVTDWRFVTSGPFAFLRDCFDAYALSFEARSMKPERSIFDYAAAKAGASPADVFFTDDKSENVAGARAAGFDAVTFLGTEPLRLELKRRGIKGV